MINFDTYRRLYGEAKEYDNIDMYIMERGWQDWMDDMSADEITKLLRAVYSIGRDGFKSMVEISGTKLAEFCRRYLLPYRSAQNWLNGEREAPEYTMLLLGYAVLSDI